MHACASGRLLQRRLLHRRSAQSSQSVRVFEIGRLDRRARPRCGSAAARRDGRRCRRRRLPCRAARRCARTNASCAARSSAVTAGSTIFRQTEVLERVAGSTAKKSIHGVLAAQSASTVKLASARAHQALEPADRLRPVQRVEIVLDAEHRRRVDRLADEDAVDQLAALGHAEDLRQRPGRRCSSRAGRRRAGDRISMPCAASPPSAFCQEKVTTSSLSKGSAWAKAADVASQIVRPARSAGIQSPFGTRTPEVVPFQVKTTSREKSTCRDRAACRSRP